MKRIPASLVLLVLRQEADKLEQDGDMEAADRLRISPATLRSWVHREHITRTRDGYDLAEILKYLTSRDTPSRDEVDAGHEVCNA